MDDDDRAYLVSAVAEELEDSVGITTEADRVLTARVVVARMESTFLQLGWRPPATYDRIVTWSAETARLPEHHINRDVLCSQLTELSQILRDR